MLRGQHFGVGDVEDGVDTAGAAVPGERLGVDEGAARSVDQHRAVRHGREPPLVDETSGLGQVRRVQGDDVAACAQGVRVAQFCAQSPRLGGSSTGNHPASEPADPGKITANPLLTPPGSTDPTGYTLKSGSPARCAGQVTTDSEKKDYFGAAGAQATQMLRCPT